MKKVTLQIPEKKYDFFMELFSQLGLSATTDETHEIPEEQKKIVEERIRKSEADPNRLLDWNDVKEDLNVE